MGHFGYDFIGEMFKTGNYFTKYMEQINQIIEIIDIKYKKPIIRWAFCTNNRKDCCLSHQDHLFLLNVTATGQTIYVYSTRHWIAMSILTIPANVMMPG